jgi:uncharacterized protein involved in propanediol utilization
MVKLSKEELEKILHICEEASVDYFTLHRGQFGIGSILTLTYDTFVSDFPAKMSVEVSGVENW